MTGESLFEEIKTHGGWWKFLDAQERVVIDFLLKRTGGMVAPAARILKINRPTLVEKMRRLGIVRSTYSVESSLRRRYEYRMFDGMGRFVSQGKSYLVDVESFTHSVISWNDSQKPNNAPHSLQIWEITK